MRGPLVAVVVVGSAFGLASCGGGTTSPGNGHAPSPAQPLPAFPSPQPASCTFGVGWSASDSAVTLDFDPPIVDPRAPEPVALKVKTADPSVDSVRLQLASGDVVPLASSGGDLYCALLTPTQVLAGYTAAGYQHNFVGFLDAYRGGTRVFRANMFIGVADEAVPDVPVERIADEVQVSPRVVNVIVPSTPPSKLDARQLIATLYRFYPDAYDFVCLVSVPSSAGTRYHVTVRNDVQGTGAGRMNDSASYGSAGKLLGYSRYPAGSGFDIGETASIHEIGHQWINYLHVPALRSGVPHWPISSLAYGVMGFTIPNAGGQGGRFPFQLTPLGNGDYRLDRKPYATAYNDMELYLMGLAPSTSVGTHIVPLDQNQKACDGCVLKGPVATVTVQDVIAAEGERVPPFPAAQTRFSLATIVVTMERPLTPREIAFFDYFAARGEATGPLPFTSGFFSGTTLPFAAATGGRASLATALGPRLR